MHRESRSDAEKRKRMHASLSMLLGPGMHALARALCTHLFARAAEPVAQASALPIAALALLIAARRALPSADVRRRARLQCRR